MSVWDWLIVSAGAAALTAQILWLRRSWLRRREQRQVELERFGIMHLWASVKRSGLKPDNPTPKPGSWASIAIWQSTGTMTPTQVRQSLPGPTGSPSRPQPVETAAFEKTWSNEYVYGWRHWVVDGKGGLSGGAHNLWPTPTLTAVCDPRLVATWWGQTFKASLHGDLVNSMPEDVGGAPHQPGVQCKSPQCGIYLYKNDPLAAEKVPHQVLYNLTDVLAYLAVHHERPLSERLDQPLDNLLGVTSSFWGYCRAWGRVIEHTDGYRAQHVTCLGGFIPLSMTVREALHAVDDEIMREALGCSLDEYLGLITDAARWGFIVKREEVDRLASVQALHVPSKVAAVFPSGIREFWAKPTVTGDQRYSHADLPLLIHSIEGEVRNVKDW